MFLPKIISRHATLSLLFGLFSIAFLFTGCEQEYTPKPKGYNRIDLRTPKYQPLQEKHPYFFEYSAYA